MGAAPVTVLAAARIPAIPAVPLADPMRAVITGLAVTFCAAVTRLIPPLAPAAPGGTCAPGRRRATAATCR